MEKYIKRASAENMMAFQIFQTCPDAPKKEPK